MSEEGNTGNSNLTNWAETEVDKLVKAARWSKLYIRVLGVVAGVLIIVAVVLGNVIKSQGDIIQDVRNGAVSTCSYGNEYRDQQTQIWKSFYDSQAAEQKATAQLLAQLIAVLGDNNPAKINQINTILSASDKISSEQQKQFLTTVEKVNAERDCSQVYQITSSGSIP